MLATTHRLQIKARVSDFVVAGLVPGDGRDVAEQGQSDHKGHGASHFGGSKLFNSTDQLA